MAPPLRSGAFISRRFAPLDANGLLPQVLGEDATTPGVGYIQIGFMSIDGHIYISDMASLLDRAEHTIRQWLARDDFPAALKPSREGGREKIYWTQDQLAGMKNYAEERAARRGSWGRAPAA
jgi:hypothetical protein